MLSKKSCAALALGCALAVSGMAMAQPPPHPAPGGCPALNGQMPPGAPGCPALEGGFVDPKAMGPGVGKDPECPGCPGWKGGFYDPKVMGPAAGDGPKNPATKCPALANKKATKPIPPEARLRKIARALEGNKQSAQLLIEAAAKAGADPNVIEDMTQLSRAFRELFMAAVPPEQLLESILGAPGGREESQGIIITAPDGSQWRMVPHGVPTPPPGRPPHMGKPPVPPAQAGPGAPKGLLPPAEVLQDPSLRTPPPPPLDQPPAPQSPAVEPQADQPQAAPGETILFNETLPYWPTKDHLGKEGLLKYLEKFQGAQQ